MDLIYDKEQLICCKSNTDFKQNQDLAKKLFKVLSENPAGNKLACNQVGITDYRVAVINIREPLYFINPIILNKSIQIQWISDDLSFPQKIVPTIKYAKIQVSADNFLKPIMFGPTETEKEFPVTHPIIQEACAIQHVVDMLNGITMLDVRFDRKSKKIGRNEIVTLVKKNEQDKRIKYKFAQKFLADGWNIKE